MKKLGVLLLGVGLLHAQEGQEGMDLEALLYGTELVVEAATKRVERAVEAPSNVTVFTYEDLQKLGVQTVLELIRLIPGGDVHLESLLPMATIRGLTTPYANKILFLIDGRPMNTAALGYGYYDFQQPIGPWVERVEIIKGPGSALYGANAYAGVINIVTRKPDTVAHAAYEVGAGELGTGYLSGFATARLPGDGAMMLGGRFLFSEGFDPTLGVAPGRDTAVGPNAEHEDEFLRARFAWGRHELSLWALRNQQGRFGSYRYPTPFDRSRELRVMADLSTSFDLSANVRLSTRFWGDYLEGNYRLSRTVVPVRGDVTDQMIQDSLFTPRGSFPVPIHAIVFEGPGDGADDTLWVFNPLPAPIGCGDDRYHSSLVNVWAVLSGAVPADTVIAHQCDDVVGTMDTTTMRERLTAGKFMVITDPVYTTFTTRRAFETQVGGELQVDFALGNAHYVIAGVQALYQRVNHEAIQQGKVFTGVNVGAFLQWQWQMSSWLKTLGGFRYDYNSIYGTFAAPRLALVATPLPRLVAKVMYGWAFRAPNYVEIYVDQLFATARAVGNQNLRVEGIQTAEFFLSYTPSRYLKVEGSVYYNILNDVIWSSPTLQPLFVYFPAVDPNNFPIPGMMLPQQLRNVPTRITYENYPEVKQFGVEARLESRPTPFLHLFADLAYMKFSPSDTVRLYFLNYYTSNADAGFTLRYTMGNWSGDLTFVRHFSGGRNVHFFAWKDAGLWGHGFANVSAALRYRFLEFRVLGYNIWSEDAIFNPYPWEEYKQGLRPEPTEKEQWYPDARRLVFQVRLNFNL